MYARMDENAMLVHERFGNDEVTLEKARRRNSRHEPFLFQYIHKVVQGQPDVRTWMRSNEDMYHKIVFAGVQEFLIEIAIRIRLSKGRGELIMRRSRQGR